MLEVLIPEARCLFLRFVAEGRSVFRWEIFNQILAFFFFYPQDSEILLAFRPCENIWALFLFFLSDIAGKPHLGTEKQLILVANAHMHWDPEYSDVKLVQTMMFLSEVKNIIDKASRSLQSNVLGEFGTIPLVLCADLNSLPDSGKQNNAILHRTLADLKCFCNVLFLIIPNLVKMKIQFIVATINQVKNFLCVWSRETILKMKWYYYHFIIK